MNTAISSILILFFEYKANRLRPAIVKYLHEQKTYWEKTLEKFYSDDKVTRDMFQSEEEILKNIRDIEDELAFENSYQLLKQKYHKNKKLLVTLASEYQKFWACLDFFRLSHGLNANDPVYANTATQVGSTKMQIYKLFQDRITSA
jgi:hypothetical protein